jgi:type II secretory pathway pseudopilin PulG
MRRWSRQDGGTLTRVLVTLLVFAVLIFAGLYFFTKAQHPLALGNAVDATVAFSDVLRNQGTDIDPKITLAPNGQVYVATTVHNTGDQTVTLEGLGTVPVEPEVPYIPVDLRLGDGIATDTAATTPFTNTPLPPGGSVGVLVLYVVNPSLNCTLFTDLSAGSGTEIASFPMRFTTFGIENQQTLSFTKAIVTVERPTRADCDAATGG